MGKLIEFIMVLCAFILFVFMLHLFIGINPKDSKSLEYIKENCNLVKVQNKIKIYSADGTVTNREFYKILFVLDEVQHSGKNVNMSKKCSAINIDKI